ncbi:hypothetical protein BU17DRAFT_51160 [Hysterangium stoloniferum]|nr:hypothetical protein BU17DRAFT_51160 [Hysterangium stoloniferum]
MATPAARPPARRPSASSTSSPKAKVTPTSSIISKGATARSAVSPRAIPSANGRARTPSASGSSPGASPVPAAEPHMNNREALVASLKRETDEKEDLLLRLQGKETQIGELTKENDTMTSALHAAETRLTELYSDQSRMEEDMANRLEIAEKLRAQVRELEKDKREALRRYAEQTATFEAERQALYDNEQHLKSRVQSLTAARKAQQEMAERPSSPVPSITAASTPSNQVHPPSPTRSVAGHLEKDETTDRDADVSDGPEITALKLELSTLSTSHTSLQTMVQMLQTELTDLKRVNNELQEENESYGLLLMERALNGTGVDMLRQMGGHEQSSSRAESVTYEEDRNLPVDEGERSSIRSSKRSILDRVVEDDELALEMDQHDGLPNSLAAELQMGQESANPSSRRRRTRPGSLSGSPMVPGTPVGESLADLPITGPGLDLAAELGRAETKDILDGNSVEHNFPDKIRTSRKLSDAYDAGKGSSKEVDVLRQEVKSLKDANKALSLYASKIIDRIIMQEGFEHVLSVDYDSAKAPATPRSPSAFTEVLARSAKESPQIPKERPKNNMLKFPSTGEPEKLTTFTTPASSSAPDPKRNRRSLSFDWKSFSVFGGGTPAVADKEKNLRPLTLRPGAESTLSSARKLESQEDEDDRKERERLNATMKLMGIEKPAESATTQPVLAVNTEMPPKPAATKRFSFFGSKATPTPVSDVDSPTTAVPTNLTSEALEEAEAETSLASLDAREKILTAEIAKGSGGGFTELGVGGVSLGEQWRSRRAQSLSGKSHDSSGASTVWSAGKGDDEDDA